MDRLNSILKMYSIHIEIEKQKRKIDRLVYHANKCKKIGDSIKLVTMSTVSVCYCLALVRESNSIRGKLYGLQVQKPQLLLN